MKIVHLAQFYYPHLGGVEQHLNQINQLLSPEHRVTVITRQHQKNLPLQEKIEQVNVLRLPVDEANNPKWLYKLQLWRALWRYKKVLQQADIIQVHDVFFWLLPFLPFLKRQKIFITFHGYEGHCLPNKRQIFWHKLAAWYCHKNLCIGDFHQKWYGIKADAISYGAVADIKSPPSQFANNQPLKIIFLGRLDYDTGLMTYLKAIHLAQSQQLKIKLDIYGDGPLMAKAQDYVKTNQLPVKFYGFIKNASSKLPNYHLTFASQYLSILESLAYHIPVIAVYHNQLKKDYLAMTPFVSWIEIVNDQNEVFDRLKKIAKNLSKKNQTFIQQLKTAQLWAQQQNWQKLAETYLQLWGQT